MIKHDIGHLHCPYFEEIYDSGLHLLLIPRKSQLKSASITICRGGLQHEREIASSKIPFGTAYYLSQAILSPDFKNELKKDGISASLSFDYSYTIYQLDTVNDLYKGVAKLMKRIAKACYKEDDVTSIWEREKKTPSSLEIAQKKVLEGLYTASPIRYGVKPNSEEGKRIHASALKKYQDANYICPNLLITLALDDTPEHMIEELKKMDFPSLSSKEDEKPLLYLEDYKNLVKEYQEVKSEEPSSLLTYGIKLAPRQNLYEAFGQSLFADYELLTPLLFNENAAFLDEIHSRRALLEDVSLKVGAEDACLLLSFRTEDPDPVLTYLTEFFAHPDKQYTGSLFHTVQEAYFLKAEEELSNPSFAVSRFAKASADHIPYTELVRQIHNLSVGTASKFFATFAQYKRAAFFLKKENSGK